MFVLDKKILLYLAAAAFILIGLFCKRSAAKTLSTKDKMMKVPLLPPTRNYGKPIMLLLGLLCLGIGISLLLSKAQ
jgi:hypothetical protein